MPPLIENELGWVGNRVAFSFTNLIEMKFVAFLRMPGSNSVIYKPLVERGSRCAGPSAPSRARRCSDPAQKDRRPDNEEVVPAN